MGNNSSKNKDKKNIPINDFNMITIPKEYELIKLATYNINIRNTVNLTNKIKEILTYTTTSFKNKDIDILCLQGIHDYNSVYKLVKELKKYGHDKRERFYFGPEFDDIDSKSDNDILSIKNKFKSSLRTKSNISKGQLRKKLEIQNIIISKYPIVTTIYAELDDKLELDDILGTKTIIGANISIYGNIISVYTTTLSKDIKSANLINTEIREKEIKAIFKTINENKKRLKGEEFNHYLITDMHFLAGSLYINETFGNDLNPEFINFAQKYHCVDIFRIMFDNKVGHTNTSKERMDYILFLLSDDIYKKSSHYKKLQNVKTSEDLFKLIFKIYKIYFLDVCVRKDTHTNHSIANYPLESVFMIYKNRH